MTYFDHQLAWPDAARWRPEDAEELAFVPPRKPRPILTLRFADDVPEADRQRLWEEAWAQHCYSALLEHRCPHCLGRLKNYTHRGDERAAAGWRHCPTHGWWRRIPVSHGIPGGWSWQLGYNPHTGEPSWESSW